MVGGHRDNGGMKKHAPQTREHIAQGVESRYCPCKREKHGIATIYFLTGMISFPDKIHLSVFVSMKVHLAFFHGEKGTNASGSCEANEMLELEI